MIYDAAQGLGCMVDSQPIGNYGDYVAFSLGRSKLFSIGEGGILICGNQKLYEKAIAFSQHPLRMHREIDNEKIRTAIDGVSMNFRMHPLVASLALGQLEGFILSGKLEKLRKKFQETYRRLSSTSLTKMLPRIPEGGCANGMILPFIISTKDDLTRCEAECKMLKLDIFKCGIQNPLHLSSTIRRKRLLCHGENGNFEIYGHNTHKSGSCPEAERRCRYPQIFVKIHSN